MNDSDIKALKKLSGKSSRTIGGEVWTKEAVLRRFKVSGADGSVRYVGYDDLKPSPASLTETLRTASKAKVDIAIGPTLTRTTTLRAALDSYESALREEMENGIVNEALKALGQEPLGSILNVVTCRQNLRTALGDLLSLLEGLPSPEPAPAPAPEPLKPEPINPEPAPPPEPEMRPEYDFSGGVRGKYLQPKPPKANPEPSDLDVERTWKLIAEVENFAKSDFGNQPTIRTQHLLQAFVAEARQIMERIPYFHDLHHALGDRVIRTCTRLKTEAGIQPFIKGLAFGSKDNWYRIAKESRRRVEKFDQDANEPLVPKDKPKSNPVAAPKPEERPSYQWPELPLLRQYMKDQEWPLLIVGGSYKDQKKLDMIYERFGVRCEWVPFDASNPRVCDSLAARIVTGKITGIILLEGFMSHKAYRRLMKAADQNKSVPIAMGGKGGVTAISDALGDLERMTSAMVYRIPLVKVDPKGVET